MPEELISNIVALQKNLGTPKYTIMGENGSVAYSYSKTMVELIDDTLEEIKKYLERGK